RVEGAVDVIGRTLVLQRQFNGSAQTLAKGTQHARLADPRLAPQQYHLAFTPTRELPAIEQQPDLQLASHHQGQPPAGGGIEAASGVAGPQHSPSARGLGNAFKRVYAAILVLEATAGERAGALAQDHLPRLRQRLKAGSQVRRLAHSAPVRRQDMRDDY